MPLCPECKYEYVPGTTECPDCRQKLVDKLPEGGQPVVEPPGLACVGTYASFVDAQLAKLRLESGGIQSALQNEISEGAEAGMGITGRILGIWLMVDKDDVHKACEILASGD